MYNIEKICNALPLFGSKLQDYNWAKDQG
jgi:hypothetical protein